MSGGFVERRLVPRSRDEADGRGIRNSRNRLRQGFVGQEKARRRPSFPKLWRAGRKERKKGPRLRQAYGAASSEWIRLRTV